MWHGEKDFTTAGTAEQLIAPATGTTTYDVARVHVQAKRGNTGWVKLGIGTGTSGTSFGVELAASEQFTFGLGSDKTAIDATKIYGTPTVDDEGVTYIVETTT